MVARTRSGRVLIGCETPKQYAARMRHNEQSRTRARLQREQIARWLQQRAFSPVGFELVTERLFHHSAIDGIGAEVPSVRRTFWQAVHS